MGGEWEEMNYHQHYHQQLPSVSSAKVSQKTEQLPMPTINTSARLARSIAVC